MQREGLSPPPLYFRYTDRQRRYVQTVSIGTSTACYGDTTYRLAIYNFRDIQVPLSEKLDGRLGKIFNLPRFIARQLEENFCSEQLCVANSTTFFVFKFRNPSRNTLSHDKQRVLTMVLHLQFLSFYFNVINPVFIKPCFLSNKEHHCIKTGVI